MSPESELRAIQPCLSLVWDADINSGVCMLTQCPYQNRGTLSLLSSYFYFELAPFLSFGELELKKKQQKFNKS